ncbi:MAG: RNA 2',3'-cyclic phosphodiesterase [Planctomycetota bacterium]
MRLFWAVVLPEDLRRRLAAQGNGVRGLRQTRLDSLHLTLRFLGDIEDPEPAIAAGRRAAAEHEPFALEFQGLGVFPQPGRARVFWAGLGAGAEAVTALAASLETELVAEGLAPAGRPWRGHVTLGRFRSPAPVNPALLDPDEVFGTAPVDRIVLLESHLVAGGARHVPLQELSLLRG